MENDWKRLVTVTSGSTSGFLLFLLFPDHILLVVGVGIEITLIQKKLFC